MKPRSWYCSVSCSLRLRREEVLFSFACASVSFPLAPGPSSLRPIVEQAFALLQLHVVGPSERDAAADESERDAAADGTAALLRVLGSETDGGRIIKGLWVLQVHN